MKTEMSGVDVHCVVDELSRLVGGKIGKIYQHGESELRLSVHTQNGREHITIEAGRRIHLTRHPKLTPIATSFAMLARKLLQGGRLTAVEQQGFDRLVRLTVERAGETRTVVAELFARGGVLILDEGETIVASLRQFSYRDRSLRTGRRYVPPPPQPDPEHVNLAELLSGSDVVRTLATRAGLGGVYAEEVCAAAGIDKHTPCSTLTPEHTQRLEDALEELLSRLKAERKPNIVLDGKKRIDCTPIELVRYAEYEKQYFETFSEALDEYFLEHEPAVPKQQPVSGESALEHRLMTQRRTLEAYEKKRADAMACAELLYSSYTQVEEVLNALKGKDLNRVEPYGIVAGVSPKDRTATLVLDGKRVEVLVDGTVERSAQRYYELAKKLSRKIEGARAAIEHTEREIRKGAAKPEKPSTAVSERDIPKRRAWYERLRWFFSSDGFLVIGGRDARTNEEVYEKYMEKRDLVLHASAHGAPLTVIKTEGRDVPETTLHEAAVFAVSFSSVWKAGQFSGECYLVSPEQVSKTPESGEYIPTGSFVIRGKRRYFTVPVGAAIGVERHPLRLVAGPPSAIESRAMLWFELEPGELAKNDLAKRLYRRLTEHMPRGLAKRVAPPDAIAAHLPPGGSRMRAEHSIG